MDLPSGSVSSNMESYLARTPVDEDDDTLDAQRILVYLIMMITFVNLTFTYLFIHLVLKFKHSEAIKIAEKTTSNTKGNLISFKMQLTNLFTTQNWRTFLTPITPNTTKEPFYAQRARHCARIALYYFPIKRLLY